LDRNDVIPDDGPVWPKHVVCTVQ